MVVRISDKTENYSKVTKLLVKPKNNKKFWIEKIEENISRDKRNDVLLNNMGWIPLHFWSKDVEKNLDVCVDEILEYVSYQMQGRIIE